MNNSEIRGEYSVSPVVVMIINLPSLAPRINPRKQKRDILLEIAAFIIIIIVISLLFIIITALHCIFIRLCEQTIVLVA